MDEDVVVVVAEGSVGVVTAPTQAQKGGIVAGPLLQSADCGVGHVTAQVCGGEAEFVPEQEESAKAAAGTRINAAASRTHVAPRVRACPGVSAAQRNRNACRPASTGRIRRAIPPG